MKLQVKNMIGLYNIYNSCMLVIHNEIVAKVDGVRDFEFGWSFWKLCSGLWLTTVANL